MIVTPDQSIGIDKIRVFYPDYRVKDATRSGFMVMPGTVDLSTGATTDRPLFRDAGGAQISGNKATRNTEYYQATITDRGLLLQVNPSKPWHPFDLVHDDNTLQERMQVVFQDLKDRGVLASWEGGNLTRIDLARNVLMNNPVNVYGKAWPWLRMKREKQQRQYPDGYGTGNNSLGAIFYDKGKESGQYQGNNLLRGELQFKRNRAITANTGCKYFGQIFQAGIPALQDVYRKVMGERVLRIVEAGNVHAIKFDDEIQVLKKLIQDSPRTAISRHLMLIGLPTFMELYGTPDVYAEVLKEAGFSRMTISRQLRQIRKQIELYSMIYRDERNTVGKLIRELSYRLTA